MRCVVCLDAEVSRSEDQGRVYTCPSGCRGRRAVCADCDARLRRCVFCRSRIVHRNAGNHFCPEDEEDESGPLVATFAFFVLFFSWLLFIASLMLVSDPATQRPHNDEEAMSEDAMGEDAMGVPLVPWDLDALD